MTVIHCRVGRAPGGDRVSVYVGRAPDMLHLAGIIWVSPSDTTELVRRLEDPDLQPEWARYEPDDPPGTIPFPAAAVRGESGG